MVYAFLFLLPNSLANNEKSRNTSFGSVKQNSETTKTVVMMFEKTLSNSNITEAKPKAVGSMKRMRQISGSFRKKVL
jgi:hypothetical protein